MQIAVRLEPHELGILDAEVTEGRAKSRSDAVRQSIVYLDRFRGYKRDAEIMAHVLAAGEDLYPDLADIPPAQFEG